jgi:hypothetical protein
MFNFQFDKLTSHMGVANEGLEKEAQRVVLDALNHQTEQVCNENKDIGGNLERQGLRPFGKSTMGFVPSM